jgi:hypothetical protein
MIGSKIGGRIPVIFMMREAGLDAREWIAFLFEKIKRIGAEECAVFIAIEHMDHDRPAQQIRPPAAQKDQDVDGMKRLSAGDIDEMQRKRVREGRTLLACQIPAGRIP